jgi:hypothetical protein
MCALTVLRIVKAAARRYVVVCMFADLAGRLSCANDMVVKNMVPDRVFIMSRIEEGKF